MSPLSTPVLIIIFNRPDKVRALIKSLEKVRPKIIYVSADGPRPGVIGDIKKCREARDMFKSLPWECQIHTNFSEVNLGCKQGPISGINWFFNNVESGIILEDDCIPHPTFFSFCSTLLEKYSNDEQIMHISGNNFQDGKIWGDGSYYFSRYTLSWGWASWRRAWNKFEPALKQFPEFIESEQIKYLGISRKAQKFWIKNFKHTLKHNDSWDSLWLYTTWLHKGLSILPNRNLVSNIGFDDEATHTFIKSDVSNLRTDAIEVIVHPSNQEVQTEADEFVFMKNFYLPLHKRVTYKLNGIISKLWK